LGFKVNLIFVKEKSHTLFQPSSMTDSLWFGRYLQSVVLAKPFEEILSQAVNFNIIVKLVAHLSRIFDNLFMKIETFRLS
jgi:hypothetical protein